MLKVSKMVFAVLRNTVYIILLLISLMSKMSKMPNTIVLCIQGLLPLQGEGYLFEPSALWFSSYTTSQSKEAALLTFLDLTTRVIGGKMHSQSPILKSKGALSNPVILTYL